MDSVADPDFCFLFNSINLYICKNHIYHDSKFDSRVLLKPQEGKLVDMIHKYHSLKWKVSFMYQRYTRKRIPDLT